MTDLRHPLLRRLSAATATAAVLLVLPGCSLFDKDDAKDDATDVNKVEAGDCLAGPTEVQELVTELVTVSCGQPHAQEAFARIDYVAPTDTAITEKDQFPGADELSRFADSACAQAFETYVGISYLDSQFYFTYLLPSPQGWEQDEREVLCIVTDAGRDLTGSVKDRAE